LCWSGVFVCPLSGVNDDFALHYLPNAQWTAGTVRCDTTTAIATTAATPTSLSRNQLLVRIIASS
jgi:hypothetical protein